MIATIATLVFLGIAFRFALLSHEERTWLPTRGWISAIAGGISMALALGFALWQFIPN